MIKTVQDLKDKMVINPKAVNQEIQKNIIHYQKEFKKQGAVIGLSGGLDSAVVTVLCVQALGKEKVKVLLLPDSESKREHLRDALDFARKLKIKWKIIHITPLMRALHIKKYSLFSYIPFFNKVKEFLYLKGHHYYQKSSGETPFASQLRGLSDKPYHGYIRKGQSILYAKHRLRMVLLYYYAEQENRMVVGCTNKTEYQIGLFVKYGCDHLADIMPINHLYKTQIYQLAKYLKTPHHFIQKEPSPDLLPGLDDYTMIGMPYDQIDLILLAREYDLTPENISHFTDIDLKNVQHIFDLNHYAQSRRDEFFSY